MISREYETFIQLGGDINYQDIIDSRCQELKECKAYQSIPSSSQQLHILEKTALMTIAQDQVYLITLVAKTKQALNDGDVELAKFYMECAFI